MDVDINKMLAYLRDELSSEDEATIDARIAEDDEFAWILERLHQKIIINEGTEEELEEFERVLAQESYRIANAENSGKKLSHKRSFPYYWIYAAAAAVALILAMFLWSQPPTSALDLGKEYLATSHYSDNIGSRGISSDLQERVNLAITLYRQKNVEGYRESIPIVESLLLEVDNAPLSLSEFTVQELRIIHAVSLLKIGQTELAIAKLTDLHAKVGQDKRNDIIWYLGMAHLQSGQLSEALPFMQTLTESSNSYQEKARIIVDLAK